METKFKNLQNKIYLMSNSFLPLNMFFNDIRDNKAENYDKEMAYKDLEIIADFILDLQQQLVEKDKEIEHLKDGLNMCQSIKRYDIGEMLTENTKLKQSQTQLAIQELEKMEDFILKNTMLDTETAAVLNYIYQQIKELKGE